MLIMAAQSAAIIKDVSAGAIHELPLLALGKSSIN